MKEYVKILVADHEVMMRNLILRILESEGYQLTLVPSAASALHKLAAEIFDLFLVDMKLPDIDGFDLLKKIKTQWPDMAVIVMTGYGDAATVKEALLLGADEYLSRPFNGHEVSLIVERAYWRLLSARRAKGEESSVSPGEKH